MADGYVVEAAGVTKRFRIPAGSTADCRGLSGYTGGAGEDDSAYRARRRGEDDIPSHGLRADVSY